MTERQYFCIPVELITAIFLMLPPRALMKLACVCKQWKSLITNPIFVKEYSKISASRGMNSILYVPMRNAENMSFNLLANGSFDGPLAFEQIPFPFHTMNCMVVGCIDGLLCFSDATDFGKSIYLFNPCIRKYRIIRSSTSDMSIPRDRVLGFAYHSETDDCIIIRIHNHEILKCWVDTSSKSTIEHADVQVEVYSVSTNSWKQIYVDSFPWDVIYSYSGIQVNESLYWFSNSKASEIKKIILSFDLRKETFKEIGLPDFGEGDDEFGEFLGVHKKALSIFKYYPFLDSPQAEFCYLWVMKQYGVESSWTKVYTVKLSGLIISRPLNFTTRGEILLEDQDANVLVYNFDDQKMKFTGIEDEYSNLASVNYTQSLLLVNEPVNREAGAA